MISTRTFQKGDVICKKGDPGDCMYCIQGGKAGVYEEFGMPEEKKLAELETGALFGEMSLLDHEPRSATVVAAEDNTVLQVISENTFREFLEYSPETVQQLIEQMSHRLRQTTRDYVEACRTVYDAVEVEKNGGKKSEGLLARIRKLCSVHVDAQKKQRA